LCGLDKVEAATQDGRGKYLLSIDSVANNRGQVIIASGNPDTADHVVTTVPGTYSSLGDAMDYVQRGDALIGRAQQLAPLESFASITYADYNSPDSLATAGMEQFALDGGKNLSSFQEGLRATHESGQPSHNTVIGHSYGSTEVGYAARDHGMAADDLVFIGSPGVGVEHADELGLPPERVWAGTSGLDEIQIASSGNPIDWITPSDDMWYGKDPSDEAFGGRQLPTGTWARHGDYWDNPESLDGMARVVAGKAG
jgi:alpha/beta hydrolase family protein